MGFRYDWAAKEWVPKEAVAPARLQKVSPQRYLGKLGEDMVPADPTFMRLCADLRTSCAREPADQSDWPKGLETRTWRSLMHYLLTLEYP